MHVPDLQHGESQWTSHSASLEFALLCAIRDRSIDRAMRTQERCDHFRAPIMQVECRQIVAFSDSRIADRSGFLNRSAGLPTQEAAESWFARCRLAIAGPAGKGVGPRLHDPMIRVGASDASAPNFG